MENGQNGRCGVNSDWVRVSGRAPCPVCGKPDWCGVSADGVWCVCMRVESGRRSRNNGYVHLLADAPPVPVRRRQPPSRERRLFDPAGYHAALRRQWDWRWLDGFSLGLGVGMEALEALEPAFDPMHEAFAFPMRDAEGRIVGIRLRAENGRKWAVRGSREGLFYAPGMTARDLVVCEGPTDAAAAMTLGLAAVGRPSCAGAASELVALCRRLRVRALTIVADNDAPKRRPDGAVWRPGVEGAETLARSLKRMYRVVVPPAKDLRAWVCDGATAERFEDLARQVRWRVAA